MAMKIVEEKIGAMLIGEDRATEISDEEHHDRREAEAEIEDAIEKGHAHQERGEIAQEMGREGDDLMTILMRKWNAYDKKIND